MLITDTSDSKREVEDYIWEKIIEKEKQLPIIAIGLKKKEFKNKIINLTSKTTIQEAINLVANAKKVFSNETSFSHLAYFLNVPSIVFLGGGHFGRFLPWKDFEDRIITIYYKKSMSF